MDAPKQTRTELDARYLWIFPVVDVHGRDATLGIGLDDGHVIVSTPGGWCRVEDPELVEKIGYSFTTASYAVRQQRQKEPPVR